MEEGEFHMDDMKGNQQKVTTQKKSGSKKKIIAVTVLIIAIVAFTVYIVRPEASNVIDDFLENVEGENQPQAPSQNNEEPTQSVSLKPGTGTLLYEDLNIDSEWSKEIYLEEATFLNLRANFDKPVVINLFVPLDTGKQYVTNLNQDGWVTRGKTGTYTLKVIPETTASGQIMLTEIGRI